MAAKRIFKLGLRVPNTTHFRQAKPGESRLYVWVDPAYVSSVASKIGGVFTQRTMFLLDPVTAETIKVCLVTCDEPCPPRAKKKRVKKSKEQT